MKRAEKLEFMGEIVEVDEPSQEEGGSEEAAGTKGSWGLEVKRGWMTPPPSSSSSLSPQHPMDDQRSLTQ